MYNRYVKYLKYKTYKWYNKYMYTFTSFRTNLRKAFTDADAGHEVVIERYGQLFQLVSLVDGPLPGHSIESTPTDRIRRPRHVETFPDGSHGVTLKVKDSLEPEDTIIIPPHPGIGRKAAENGVCKVHATPLDNRGKCLVKGCKNG